MQKVTYVDQEITEHGRDKQVTLIADYQRQEGLGAFEQDSLLELASELEKLPLR